MSTKIEESLQQVTLKPLFDALEKEHPGITKFVERFPQFKNADAEFIERLKSYLRAMYWEQSDV